MRAVIYARYSSDLQSDRSIEDQLRDCRAHAVHQGFTVGQVYSDAAISGATLLRPGVQQLLEHAAARRFEVVVAEALDRLSRDLGDTAQLYKLLAFHQVKLITLAEGEITPLHVGFKGTMNAQFLADLAIKIRRGQRGNIAQGLSAGGLSYGYEVVRAIGPDGKIPGGRRQIHEDRAAVVRRIFADYVAGLSPAAIARQLNAEGVAAHRGGRWTAATIGGDRQRKNGILHNELYLGLLIHGRTAKVKDPVTRKEINRLRPEKEWQRVPVPHLRIIDDVTWARAQAKKLEHGGGPRIRTKRRATHLLSDLIFCACCGSRYVARSGERLTCRGFYYDESCDNNRRVRRAWLEAEVLDAIKGLLADAAAVAEHAREYHRQVQAQTVAKRSRRRALTKEMGDVKAKIARLVDAIAEGTVTAALTAKVAELERRQGEIEAALAAADDGAVVRLQPDAHERYARAIADLVKRLNSGSAADQAEARCALRSLIERIEIRPATKDGKPSFEWRFVGKLDRFLKIAAGEHTPNKSGSWWGYPMVRVEGDSQLPPPRIELKFRA